MRKASARVRSMFLAAAGNVSLFIFTAFLVVGVLPMEPLKWYQDAIALLERYVVVPWGMALCLLRLERRHRMQDDTLHADAAALFVLLVWIVVPFAIRFGVTFNNIGSWCSHATAFFGVYLLTTEGTMQERARRLEQASLLFALLALIWGSALLGCAFACKSFGADPAQVHASGGTSGFGFGVYEREYLCAGLHYNSTGMIAVCAALLSLSGVRRGRRSRFIHLPAFAMMTVVVVLTQSRTARYALMGAFAAGAYGWFVSRGAIRRTLLRHAAGVLLGAAVLAVSYLGASALTNMALAHYAGTQQTQMAPAAQTKAETEQKAEADAAANTEANAQQMKPQEARAAADASLSGRTDIWKNLLKLWKEDPKYLLIGNGIGRTGSRVVEGTIHERNGAVALHNTYLQFIADFGMIGFGLMAAFLLLCVKPCLSALTAREDAGLRAMCMLVFACLLTGLMESQPLGAMTPMNMALFFALAQITGRNRDAESLV